MTAGRSRPRHHAHRLHNTRKKKKKPIPPMARKAKKIRGSSGGWSRGGNALKHITRPVAVRVASHERGGGTAIAQWLRWVVLSGHARIAHEAPVPGGLVAQWP